MEQTHTPTRALIKIMAIIGFFAVVALALWLLVQGVRLFPSAFSSLASIAETIGTYRPNSELKIDLEKNIVNSGETFTINWTDMGKGAYRFSYECVDGVSLRVRADDNTQQEVRCTDELTLPEGANGLFVTIEAKEQRFSDVNLTVTYDPERGDEHLSESRVTIVNATVPQKTVAEAEPETITNEETPAKPVVEEKPATPKPTPKPTSPTQPASSVVAFYPQSLPNGFVDLKMSYLGVGTIVNGSFVPKATFDEDDRAAFRFEVKNIGTKTSGDWTYKLRLPGSETFTSTSQAPLMPNERAIYTVAFDLGGSVRGSVTLEGSLEVKNDTNSKNDSFDWSVKVID